MAPNTQSSPELAPPQPSSAHCLRTARWATGLAAGTARGCGSDAHPRPPAEGQDESKGMWNSSTPHPSLGPHDSLWAAQGLSSPEDKGTGDSIGAPWLDVGERKHGSSCSPGTNGFCTGSVLRMTISEVTD